MSRVRLLAVALLAAACAASPAAGGFVETVHALAAEGRITPEVAEAVTTAYLQSRAAAAWWEPLLAETWALALALVGAVLWVRFAPAKLGGRGVPEVVRQRRAR